MKNNPSSIWKDLSAQRFALALSSIDDVDAMQNFLRDIMTEKEITEISARFEAAKMLRAGRTYADIVAATKLSSRTVARISDWLQNGTGGYQQALEVAHHSHLSPARTE